MPTYATYTVLKVEWKKLFGTDDGFYELMEYYDGVYDRKRHYHTAEHILDCVRDFYDINSRCEMIPHDRKKPLDHKRVLVPLFFHDAIYFLERGGNENQSAELYANFAKKIGRKWLGDTRKPHFVRDVQRAIKATAHLGKSSDLNLAIMTVEEQFVCDLDVLFLGKEDFEFRKMREYEANIWGEYTEVKKSADVLPDKGEYLPKRLSVLRKLLDMAKEGSLYKTEEVKEEYGERAVINLTYLLGVVEERMRAFTLHGR